MTLARRSAQLEMSGTHRPERHAGPTLLDEVRSGRSLVWNVGVDNSKPGPASATSRALHIPRVIFSRCDPRLQTISRCRWARQSWEHAAVENDA